MSESFQGDREVINYCADLYRRTRVLWRGLEGQYPTWECRFSILYGPPQVRPDLLILGRNPGFDVEDLYDEEILTWPNANEYTNKSWKLATKLRSIFADAGLKNLLARSVGTNQLFFKSKGIDRHKTGLGWKDNPLAVRKQLEEFCTHEVEGLIRLLQPKLVLALGLSVFDDIADVGSRGVEGVKGRRVAAIGVANGAKAVGIIHPTGAQVSNADWSIVAKELGRELGSGKFTAMPIENPLQSGKSDKPISKQDSGRPLATRQPAFRPSTVVRAGNKPPGTYAYQPIHDFWHQLSEFNEVTVEEFHQHMVSIGWRRPQGGMLTYDVTRTDIACMCREGFAVRVSG